jgi:hypothetical protein
LGFGGWRSGSCRPAWPRRSPFPQRRGGVPLPRTHPLRSRGWLLCGR